MPTSKPNPNESTRSNPPHAGERLARFYKAGAITKMEYVNRIPGLLTSNSVESVLGCCPSEVLSDFQTLVANLPADDDDAGWANLICIEGGSYVGSIDQHLERRRREREQGREGIRIYRAFCAGKRDD